MKLHKYMFASLSFCSLVLGSCQNNDIDDEHHYDNKVFVTSQQVRDDLLIKDHFGSYPVHILSLG